MFFEFFFPPQQTSAYHGMFSEAFANGINGFIQFVLLFGQLWLFQVKQGKLYRIGNRTEPCRADTQQTDGRLVPGFLKEFTSGFIDNPVMVHR